MNGKQCTLCYRQITGNVNAEKIKTCGNCVQILLTAPQENKIAFRGKLIAAGRLEEARCIESFIHAAEETINEPSRAFRRVVERKRPSRKIRPSHGKRRPLYHDHVLGERRPEMC